MDPQIIIALIVAAQGVATALITGVITRQGKRANALAKIDRDERARRQAEIDEREEHRQMIEEAESGLLLAVAESSNVLLISASGQHVNGNVEQARAHLASASQDYTSARDHVLASKI